MAIEIKVGMKFGHLTVLAPKEQGKKRESWLLQCECGNKIVLGKTRILGVKGRRPNRSCGCREKKYDGKTIKYQRLYGIYNSMLRRCYFTENDNYERYGGKGITVCDEWKNDFECFLEWSLANGYKDGVTIDRINSKKPYEPSNCRWADYFVQNQNKPLYKNNSLGYTGVYTHGNGYRSYITRDGVRKYLGYFSNLEDAIKARKDAEERYIKTNQI